MTRASFLFASRVYHKAIIQAPVVATAPTEVLIALTIFQSISNTYLRTSSTPSHSRLQHSSGLSSQSWWKHFLKYNQEQKPPLLLQHRHKIDNPLRTSKRNHNEIITLETKQSKLRFAFVTSTNQWTTTLQPNSRKRS